MDYSDCRISGFALSIWFGLVPYGIVEYNLGVNLFTSSIFMVFTIVFLSWLFTLRDRIHWKAVEDEVYSDIEVELGAIFYGILGITEKGAKVKNSLMNIEDYETRKKVGFNEFCKLKDAEEISLDPLMLKVFLNGKDSFELFSGIARKLSDIQIKYSKFLSPELVISPMRIQRFISLLETASELNITMKTMPKELTKIFPLEGQKRQVHRLISVSFKMLIREIYTIYERNEGIEFSYFI